jgi:hypothetical protein
LGKQDFTSAGKPATLSLFALAGLILLKKRDKNRLTSGNRVFSGEFPRKIAENSLLFLRNMI